MRLAVLSTGRQDWGILRSTCLRLRDDPDVDLRLLLGGMHCSPRFGETRHEVEGDGFRAAETLAWIADDETDVVAEAGRATERVGAALARQAPDALLVVGDRYETAAAALAATLQRVPIVHLHGGEETAGAFDDALRHAITKLSHLHLVSHPQHARRVIALGEDPATVFVVGAPGLDNLHRADLPDRAELEASLGIELRSPVVLVTLHPTTLARGDEARECDALVAAMDAVDATYVVTLPNSDPGQATLRERLIAACASVPKRRVAVEALGSRRFWGMLRVADAMAGNSSSALIEAPVVALPAVNIGDRQRGRERARNAIDAAPDAAAVINALRTALEPSTRAALAGDQGPFGDGRSAERIVDHLKSWRIPKPPRKAAVRC